MTRRGGEGGNRPLNWRFIQYMDMVDWTLFERIASNCSYNFQFRMTNDDFMRILRRLKEAAKESQQRV